jgi:hypothetical protein
MSKPKKTGVDRRKFLKTLAFAHLLVDSAPIDASHAVEFFDLLDRNSGI